MAGGKTTSSTIAVCFVLIVVLSMPVQQVAATSKFCRCYKKCYPDCRHKHAPWLCVFMCTDDCSPSVTGGGGADRCKSACYMTLKICGVPATTEIDGAVAVAVAGEDAAGEDGCVRECVKEWKNHGSMI